MAAAHGPSRLLRPVATAALGTGMVALGGLSALAVAGRRVRNRRNPELDALAEPPAGVTHHHLPTADGGTVHVVEVGTGRPIVLLHGVTLQWWVWSPLMRLLSDRYRVIAWDMPGHGESELGSDGFTMETLCRDLAMVLRELDCRDAVVAGHSLGGCLLGNAVARERETFAERVAGLAFVATAANLSDNLFRHGSAKTLWGAAGGLLLLGLRKPNPNMTWSENDLSTGVLAQAFGPHATAEMVSVVRHMTATFPADTSVRAAKVLTSHDARAALPTVTVPTLVIAGEYDRLLPPDHAREIADLVPSAHYVELGGIGHQIMQEAPRELADALDDLVERIVEREAAGSN